MTKLQAAVALALSIVAASMLAIMACGCSSAYAITAASLVTAERTVQAAAEQFPPYDRDKRKSIVEHATSREDGAASLAEWDVTANKVVKAIDGAHASVQLAADGLKGVHDGLRDPKQLSSWIAPAIRVGIDLTGLLKALGIKLTLTGGK